MQELTTDRIVAEADLAKQLGTLRYLLGLRSARQRAEAALEQAVKQEEKSQAPEGTLPGQDSSSLMHLCEHCTFALVEHSLLQREVMLNSCNC